MLNQMKLLIYTRGISNEKARIINTLIEIDPSNSSKYQTLNQQD